MKNKETEELVEIIKNTPQLKAQLEEAYDEVRYIASKEETINNKELIKCLLDKFEEQVKMCKFTDEQGHALELNVSFLQLMKELHKEVD